MKIRFIPLYFSAAITSAHFLRENSFLLAILFLVFPLINLIKKDWVRWMLVGFCGVCGVVWVTTTRALIVQRVQLGEDWTRMAIILGAVAILCVFSGYLVWTDKKALT